MRSKKLVLLMAMAPAALLAQESDSSGRVERIEVTGSYIKRVDVEGAQPVQTLDQEYLESTGYNSVSDVLREMSASSFGSQRETSGSVTGGVSSVSLRGLGADKTLILLDGRRLAKDGVDGVVDLNLIPMSAVQRIDILKDSSSALYGSDALGGVINIITKKDYNGAELSVRYERPEEKGGTRTTVQGLHGWSNERMNVTTSLQFRSNQEIYDRDRNWSDEGISSNSPNPNFKENSSDSLRAAWSTCADPLYNIGSGKTCYFDYTDYSTNLPEINQLNLISTMRYEIDPMTEVHATLQASRKEMFGRYAPGVVAITKDAANGVSGVTVPNTFTDSNGDTVTAGTELYNTRWRSLVLGTRDTETTTDMVGGNVGARRYFGETWEADLTLGTQRLDRDTQNTNGYGKQDAMLNAISTGACDIFTEGASCDLTGVAYNPWQKTKSRLDYVELRTNGELFDLPAGPLALAVGSQATYETYSDTVDAESAAYNVTGGSAITSGAGTRHSTSFFTELAIPAATGFDIQVAARYDKFSDFGDTINPKLSLMYKPVSAVLLRASAGTGFKAPNLTDLFRSESEGYPTFIDRKACADAGDPDDAACDPKQYKVKTSGNPNLKEETSKNFSVGAVIQPTKNFNFSVDYYHISLDNSVGVSAGAITQAQANGMTDAELAALGTTVTRSGTGEIESITTRYQNLDELTTQGIDVSMGYNTFLEGIGNLNINTQFSYLLSYDSPQGFPSLSGISAFDVSGSPRWRNNLTVSYSPSQKLTINANAITTAKNLMSDYETYKGTYTRYDLSGSYNVEEWNGKIALGIKNVLGTTPPLDQYDVTSQMDSALYDNIGRRVFVEYTQRF